MNNKIFDKLNNDLEKLEKRYNDLWTLTRYEREREREVQDQEYLNYLEKERFAIIDKEMYIKELLEVGNEE